MTAERYVLDTSAVLALIEDEAGADRVEALFAEGRVILPFVVLLETYYMTLRERGEEEADRRYAMLRQLQADLLWEVDEPTLLVAARMKATGSVSLADALIAAFAQRHDAVLVHKDPEYESLGSEVRLEALPYKPRQG
ncbi:MAG: PIN domain-containing protein [Anaerolineae bacterium]